RGLAIALLVTGLVLWVEASTGILESLLLSAASAGLHYRVEPGRSAQIEFPRGGPLDEERGVSRIPQFAGGLEGRGVRIAERSRFSPALLRLSRMGVPLPFRSDPVAGLVITSSRGDTMFNAARGRRVFREYSEIPPVVARSLLYIENRRLQGDVFATQNPAL